MNHTILFINIYFYVTLWIISVIIAASIFNLIPVNTETIEPILNNNQVYQKILFSRGSGLKSGLGARAKSDANRNFKTGRLSSSSTIIPGADALVPRNTYCCYHPNAPLSCKPRVKLANDSF